MPKKRDDELFDFMGMLQAALGGELLPGEPDPEELLAEVRALPQRPGTSWLVVARDLPDIPVPDSVGQPSLLLMLDMQSGQPLLLELLEEVDQDEVAQLVLEVMLEPEDEEAEPYRPELILTPDAQTAFTLGNLLREAGIRVERESPPGFEEMLQLSVGQMVQAMAGAAQAHAPKPYLTSLSDDQIREYVQAFEEFMRLQTWNVLGPDKPLYAHWQNPDGSQGQVYAVTMGELGESFGLALYPDWLSYVQHLENANDHELVLTVLDGLEAVSQGGEAEFDPEDWATLERLKLVRGKNPTGPSLLRIGLDGTKPPRTPVAAITGILKVLNQRASKKRAPASSLKGNANGVQVQFPGGPRDELTDAERAGSVELVIQGGEFSLAGQIITVNGPADSLLSKVSSEAGKQLGKRFMFPWWMVTPNPDPDAQEPLFGQGGVTVWRQGAGHLPLTLAHLARLEGLECFGMTIQATLNPTSASEITAKLSGEASGAPSNNYLEKKLSLLAGLAPPASEKVPETPQSTTPKTGATQPDKSALTRSGQPQAMCRLCGYVGTKASMTKHLATCPERLKLGANLTRQAVYRLRVSGGGPYWLDVDMPENARLDDLDSFLRGIWLECCGHMSEFDLGGPRSWGWDDAPKQDNRPISKFLRQGQKIGYTYDFGSSTDLQIAVQAYENVPLPKKPQKVRLLARNLPPQWTCSQCEQPATWAHSWEYDDQTGRPLLFCDLHAQDTDEEALLPVVNSPRMGVCAYEGGNDDEWPPAQMNPES